jgi:hypothetical protein
MVMFMYIHGEEGTEDIDGLDLSDIRRALTPLQG